MKLQRTADFKKERAKLSLLGETITIAKPGYGNLSHLAKAEHKKTGWPIYIFSLYAANQYMFSKADRKLLP